MKSKTRIFSEEARLAKNAKIKATRLATMQRRKNQESITVDLKLRNNKLSKVKLAILNKQFTEAKWLWNAIVAHGGSEGYNPSDDTVVIKNYRGEFETRTFSALGGAMRQGIVSDVEWAEKATKEKAAKGYKTGSLKFKRSRRSLPLKAHGTVFLIKGNYVRLPDVGWVRVDGVHQIKPSHEIASARLVRKADGFHLHVTLWRPLEDVAFIPGVETGVDEGVSQAVTLSDGRVFDFPIEKSERLRRLERKVKGQQVGSNGWFKTKQMILKEFLKVTRRRDNAANLAVREILKSENVFMQDEQLASWKRAPGSGAKMNKNIQGRVKGKLTRHPRVAVLSRSVATTSPCQKCSVKTPHAPSERVFVCGNPDCDYSKDREVHAAENMIIQYHAGAKLRKDFGEVKLRPVRRKRKVSVDTSGTEGCAGGGD